MAKVYVAPFVVYLVGTSMVARFDDTWYPLLYAGLIAGMAILMPILLRGTGAVRPHWRVLNGIVFGVVGIGLWIALANLHLETLFTSWLPRWLQPGERVGFNPWESLSEGEVVWFLLVRTVGIAIVVPIAEELFWRGFLLRWLIDPDWERVPLGEFTLSSCATVTLLFTLAHPEWLAAAVYCLLIQGLLYWKRDLWQCIVAHAVSNFLLVLYVLQYEAWWLW